MAESLRCSSKTITTLLIDYTQIQNKKFFFKYSHSAAYLAKSQIFIVNSLTLNPSNTCEQANSSSPLYEIPIVLEDLSGSRRVHDTVPSSLVFSFQVLLGVGGSPGM